MASYSVIGNRTAHASLAVWSIQADTITPRRLKVAEAVFGSEASAADNPFLWRLTRITATGSLAGTTITPERLDEADADALADAHEALTTNPTLGNAVLEVPLNQRATFRWVARPGQEIVTPALGEDGLACQTPTSSAVAITSSAVFTEE